MAVHFCGVFLWQVPKTAALAFLFRKYYNNNRTLLLCSSVGANLYVANVVLTLSQYWPDTEYFCVKEACSNISRT